MNRTECWSDRLQTRAEVLGGKLRQLRLLPQHHSWIKKHSLPYLLNICWWNPKQLILNSHDAKSFHLLLFIFMCKNKNTWCYILALSFCFLEGLNPSWLGWRRITPASSCPPSTTSSTTRLRCSSTPTPPTGTTGDCGACTSSPRRSGWTRAMRRPLSGEGPGWWAAASIIDECLWWNMDRAEVWLIHVCNRQPQLR